MKNPLLFGTTRYMARRAKERAVAAMTEEDSGDIAPLVFFEREGDFVAVVEAPGVDRDQALEIVNVGIPGYAAEAVALVVDIHYSTSLINPATGEEWEQGEMQQACDAEGACDVGLLQDSLFLVRHDRVAGITHTCLAPYQVDKTRREIAWLDAPDTDDLDCAGFIVGSLAEAFAVPPLRVSLIAKGHLPLGDPARQQANIDSLTTLLFTGAGAKVASRESLLADPELMLPSSPL